MTVSHLLISAIIMRECSGDFTSTSMDGKAVGPMGIKMICLEDINRFAGTHYVSADRFDLRKSIEMFNLYVGHYATEKRIGWRVEVMDKVRIWHGGPNGWNFYPTYRYWISVRNLFNGTCSEPEREAVQAIQRKVEEAQGE